MFKRYGTCMAICLIFFVIGVVIGGCIEAAAPRPNHINMNVLPWGEVTVAPEPGDVVNWAAYDQSKTLAVTFQHGASPCVKANGRNTCTITPDIVSGIFYYTCAGQANCPDPGVGPSCSGCGNNGVKGFLPTLARELGQLFQQVFFTIDRAFGLIPAEVHPSVLSPAPVEPAAPRLAPAYVYCDANGVTAVDPTNVGQSVNQFIYWAGSAPFTLSIDQTICSGNTSKPGPAQQCQLIKATPKAGISYQVTDPSCKTPTINTPTITSQ